MTIAVIAHACRCSCKIYIKSVPYTTNCTVRHKLVEMMLLIILTHLNLFVSDCIILTTLIFQTYFNQSDSVLEMTEAK